MDTWIRVLLLVALAAWNIWLGFFRADDRVLGRLVRSSGRSSLRALAVVLAYVLALVLAFAVLGVLAAVAHDVGGSVPAVLVLAVSLALVGPFSWTLAPRSMEVSGLQPGFRTDDLVAAGATRGAARTASWVGGVLWVVLVLPSLLVTGISLMTV